VRAAIDTSPTSDCTEAPAFGPFNLVAPLATPGHISRQELRGAMAEEPRDTRDDKSSAVTSAAPGALAPAQGGGSAEPPKRIPRGVVLGPDGKP
jgi:hypothetical protein